MFFGMRGNKHAVFLLVGSFVGEWKLGPQPYNLLILFQGRWNTDGLEENTVLIVVNSWVASVEYRVYVSSIIEIDEI